MGEDTGEEREAAPQKGNAERPLVRWPSGDWCGKSYHAEAKCMNCGLMCEMEIEFGRRVPGSYGDGPTCPRCGSRMWATWNTNLLGGSGFNYVPGGYEGLKAAIESESIHAPTAPPQPAPDPQAVDDLAKLLWDADSAAIEDATATKYSGPSWESARGLWRIRWRAMATAAIRAIGAREAALELALRANVGLTEGNCDCRLCLQAKAALAVTPSAAVESVRQLVADAEKVAGLLDDIASWVFGHDQCELDPTFERSVCTVQWLEECSQGLRAAMRPFVGREGS